MSEPKEKKIKSRAANAAERLEGQAFEVEGQPEDIRKSAYYNELVEVDCMVPVSINGVEFVGKQKVPRHIAQTLIPMVQAKIKTDLGIFQGKKYLVEKVAGTLKITEGKVPGEG